ncbi:DNA topoisomerase I [Parvularcula bermudensis HTCC2503]|uniref:DNA topoisomerase 1 n=1 Tax=Parvularcula bermudensis (strain ATCC BAA-594 / HTCC2503 / KCTC 12087) TaxID=314260 RepID=E0TFY8_PARBH|nr:type I DNA topoisomerase [Parvularcula bermudensis]ADM10107.1 DNA topoisomerase I [Parvularcula bermudensis HTCC2503]
MQVVIVESPSKAKTINKYLGSDYKVLASYGHIRDLPSKNGSVDPEADFSMIWESDARSKKHVSDIVDAVKAADGVILATDPDREGEAISWHLLEVLDKKKALKDKSIQRVAFNAITKRAVEEAIANPRTIDQDLVDAYLARRALDYLVGFTLSPVLWRKLPGARSAGRVQSVALRLICERELEIEKFIAEEFWTLEANVSADDSPQFAARLVKLDGTKVEKFTLTTEEDGSRAKKAVEDAQFLIKSVEAKPTRRNPAAPFTTSTLQQEASRKLGFNARRTMQTAQRLYEGITIGGETTGLITYMRTDGIDMAPEAVMAVRDEIKSTFGADYLPSSPRMYKSKQKNAQEAHECIRPTNFARHPDALKQLDQDQYRLYDLIWKRAMACQMETARLEQTTIDIESRDGKTGLRATGSVVVFDGFLKLYAEGRDDTEDEKDRSLPKVSEGSDAQVTDPTPEQHFTQPPPRFTEASLVKRLEELGIGRPSTYASIISTLQDRSYVTMDKNRFIPDDKGRIVTAFLENFFGRYVEYDFTAKLEETLDDISNGEMAWKAFLRRFWDEFHARVEDMSDLRISEVLDALNEALGPHIFPQREDGRPPRECPTCGEGELSLKVGRYGAFIGCSRYPECKHTRPLGQSEQGNAPAEDRQLGVDPDTSQAVWLKSGRFGPYVQLGEPDPDTKEKPKRSSIPKSWDAASLDFDKAMKLLALPRDVGPHPEDGEMIEASLGRYGPYVKHGKLYANLESIDDVFDIGINRAVAVLEDKKANPRGRGRSAAKPQRELGNHPDTDELVAVYDGRYGPYVKHQKTNATIPQGVDPAEITLEQALELISAREAKKPTKKKKTAKKKSAKKPAKKKTTKKAAKKATKKTTNSAGKD